MAGNTRRNRCGIKPGRALGDLQDTAPFAQAFSAPPRVAEQDVLQSSPSHFSYVWED